MIFEYHMSPLTTQKILSHLQVTLYYYFIKYDFEVLMSPQRKVSAVE